VRRGLKRKKKKNREISGVPLSKNGVPERGGKRARAPSSGVTRRKKREGKAPTYEGESLSRMAANGPQEETIRLQGGVPAKKGPEKPEKREFSHVGLSDVSERTSLKNSKKGSVPKGKKKRILLCKLLVQLKRRRLIPGNTARRERGIMRKGKESQPYSYEKKKTPGGKGGGGRTCFRSLEKKVPAPRGKLGRGGGAWGKREVLGRGGLFFLHSKSQSELTVLKEWAGPKKEKRRPPQKEKKEGKKSVPLNLGRSRFPSPGGGTMVERETAPRKGQKGCEGGGEEAILFETFGRDEVTGEED